MSDQSDVVRLETAESTAPPGWIKVRDVEAVTLRERYFAVRPKNHEECRGTGVRAGGGECDCVQRRIRRFLDAQRETEVAEARAERDVAAKQAALARVENEITEVDARWARILEAQRREVEAATVAIDDAILEPGRVRAHVERLRAEEAEQVALAEDLRRRREAALRRAAELRGETARAEEAVVAAERGVERAQRPLLAARERLEELQRNHEKARAPLVNRAERLRRRATITP